MNLNGGYAMIKHNSTQEELQIAYRSKRPALFYDENQRAHWAVIEETATESIDEETQEPITLYEYSYRLIDEASEVVANPTLSGNEATLNGLEVEGTKYKVGGGSSASYKYLHFIQLNVVDLGTLCLSIKNNDSTAFTKTSLNAWLEENGYIGYNFYNVSPLSVGSWGYAGIGISKYENSTSTFSINCLTIANNKLSIATASSGASTTILDTITEV